MNPPSTPNIPTLLIFPQLPFPQTSLLLHIQYFHSLSSADRSPPGRLAMGHSGRAWADRGWGQFAQGRDLLVWNKRECKMVPCWAQRERPFSILFQKGFLWNL